jgi:hypothetical protein
LLAHEVLLRCNEGPPQPREASLGELDAKAAEHEALAKAYAELGYLKGQAWLDRGSGYYSAQVTASDMNNLYDTAAKTKVATVCFKANDTPEIQWEPLNIE